MHARDRVQPPLATDSAPELELPAQTLFPRTGDAIHPVLWY